MGGGGPNTSHRQNNVQARVSRCNIVNVEEWGWRISECEVSDRASKEIEMGRGAGKEEGMMLRQRLLMSEMRRNRAIINGMCRGK